MQVCRGRGMTEPSWNNVLDTLIFGEICDQWKYSSLDSTFPPCHTTGSPLPLKRRHNSWFMIAMKKLPSSFSVNHFHSSCSSSEFLLLISSCFAALILHPQPISDCSSDQIQILRTLFKTNSTHITIKKWPQILILNAKNCISSNTK